MRATRKHTPRLPRSDPRYEIEVQLWTPYAADRPSSTPIRWIKIGMMAGSLNPPSLGFRLHIGQGEHDDHLALWRSSPLYAPPAVAWREVTQALADYLGYPRVPQSWLDARPTRADMERFVDDWCERHDVELESA